MNSLSGNEAVARGARDAGVRFLAAYPGSPVSELTEAFAREAGQQARWLANEKVALEVAAGVCYAGARVLVAMKQVGLNVAADPLYNLAYTGVKGGLVIVVGDDPGARNSQNEQDTRAVAAAANVPVLDPGSVEEAYVFTWLAFALSEHFDLPVILRLTTALCHSSGPLTVTDTLRHAPTLGFATPVQKYLLLPKHVLPRHRALLANLERLAGGDWGRFFYQADFPPTDTGRERYAVGLVCSGYTSGILRELLGARYPILGVGMSHPLHAPSVLDFAARCDRLLVLEEGSPFLEQRIRALGVALLERDGFEPVGELDVPAVLAQIAPDLAAQLRRCVSLPAALGTGEPGPAPLPERPPGFCSGCPHVATFVALSRRELYVVGDIGCYTMGAKAPFTALHSNLCMGASIGVLQGYLTVMDDTARRRTVAVIGDSTFLHSGLPSLLSAAWAEIPATLVLLDNSGSAMTGLQQTGPQHTAEEWTQLLGALGVQERAVVSAFDLACIEATLERFLESDRLSVLVVKGDCVQASSRTRLSHYRYGVAAHRCTGCDACFKTDCPSVTARPGPGGSRMIDIAADCVGCGVCAQVCPEQAILPLILAQAPAWLSQPLASLPWPKLIARARDWGPLRALIERYER